MTTEVPLSGVQYELRSGDYAAVVAGVGATLRVLTHHGRDLVSPFGADEMRPGMSGAVLVPWPNRTAGGRYDFGGATHQLPVTELATGTATHGLVTWLEFRPLECSAERLLLSGTIQAQPGYPWRVRVDVSFVLDGDGLTQEITATNESSTPAPVGIGAHPYLLAGPQRANAADDWRLQFDAGSVQLVTPDTLVPFGPESVVAPGSVGLDFSAPRRLGGTEVNHAFGTLRPAADGFTHVTLLDDEGVGVELVCDARSPWVQVYTADHSDPAPPRSAVAVEPITCPPDALNSGIGIAVIAPGAATSAGFRIRAVGV
jgi:aldose 1-epimerase